MSSSTTVDLMREAFRQAREAMQDGQGGPFGAVVVRGGVIVGLGGNRVVRDRDPTAHAEVVALRAACRALGTHVLSGCVLYASCEPCPMCFGAIHWARIDRMWYAATRQDARAAGFDDELLYEQVAMPLHARRLPSEQLLRHEAILLFEQWQQHPDKVAY